MESRRGTSLAFGDHLRLLRESAGVTQEELAERAGLSRDAISALERGRRRFPHPQTVRALADALGLSNEEGESLRNSARKRIAPLNAIPEPLASYRIPVPMTSLVGRASELESLRALLLDGARLITLTGPAGVGKSKLAIHLGQDVREEFREAVFVTLASIHDSELVLPTIAQAFGIRESGADSPVERIGHHFQNRPTLLMLDNLEHLGDAYADVNELLGLGAGLRIVATSQTPLRISGENEFPIVPLQSRNSGSRSTSGDEVPANAVQLFVHRARSVRPGFGVTPDNAEILAQICTQLDGLPLAIELAAARIKVLSPAALLARLDSRLDLLAGGPRDQAPRLQSIRAALAWSYDLLDAWERRLFETLSVFADSFSLEDAEAVLSVADQDLSGHGALDGLTSLVDKSLIRGIESDDGEPRFAMLQTIQEFGRERLEASGAQARIQAAHATCYLGLAERAFHGFRQRNEHEAWLNRLDRERSNLRDALTWFQESGDLVSLARLAGYLYWFWDIRGPLSEGRTWLERGLAVPAGTLPDDVRLQVMLAAGQLAHFQGDDDRARKLSEEAYMAMPESTDPWTRATPIMLLGLIAEDTGDYPLAEVRFSEALRLFQAAEDPFNTALAIHHLGVTAWGMGDIDRAMHLCEEALAEQRRLRDTWHAANSLGYLGLIAAGDGRFVDAARFLGESLGIRWRSGAAEDLASSIADFGVLASRIGAVELAVRLSGAAESIRRDINRLVINLPERAVFEDAAERIRAELPGPDIKRLTAEGAALSPDDAVSIALDLAERIKDGLVPGETM